MSNLPRRLTAEDIATGKRPLGPAEAQAQAGMKPGTFVVQCDACRGKGYMRFGTRPISHCYKCDGEGTLTIQSGRPGSPIPGVDRHMLLTVALWCLAVAGICALLLWRAGAW
jgi:hypothetical protein